MGWDDAGGKGGGGDGSSAGGVVAPRPPPPPFPPPPPPPPSFPPIRFIPDVSCLVADDSAFFAFAPAYVYDRDGENEL